MQWLRDREGRDFSLRLVTGASGFVGRRLLSSGDRSLVRTQGRVPGAMVGDLLDVPSLRAACEGVECVFHCAGFAHAFSGSDAEAHWRINCEGTRNLLAAAGEAGVRRFVFLSSVRAMAEPGDTCANEDWPGMPATPYGRAKRAAEEAVLEAGAKYGMHVVNLRPAMVYGWGGRGNLERMARGIRAGWFPPLPETGNRRSLVHVDDLVAVAGLVADSRVANGKTYIVTDARPYSGREIYDTIRLVLGRGVARWRIPAGVLRAVAKLGDFAELLTGRPLPFNSEIADRLLGSAQYSPALLERELGWRARIGLEEGIREMVGEGLAGSNGMSSHQSKRRR